MVFIDWVWGCYSLEQSSVSSVAIYGGFRYIIVFLILIINLSNYFVKLSLKQFYSFFFVKYHSLIKLCINWLEIFKSLFIHFFLKHYFLKWTKQNLILNSWKREENFGSYLVVKLKQENNCLTFITLHKNLKSNTQNQSHEHKKKSKHKRTKW